MRRAGAVDHDGTGGPHRKAETAAFQLAAQALAVGRGIPCLQGGGPDIREPDTGSGFHQALLRGRSGYGLLAVDQIVPGHPRHDVLAALFDQPMRNGAGVRSRRRLQAELERDREVHVGPAREVIARVDAAAIGADERVNPVFVEPALLVVLRADISMEG